jgi:hypothetical protein
VEGFYLELIGKFLSYQDAKVDTIIKTRQASHGLLDRWTCANGKECSQEGGRESTHTFR